MSRHVNFTTIGEDCTVDTDSDGVGPGEIAVLFRGPDHYELTSLYLARPIAEALRDQLDDLLSEGPDDGTDAKVDEIREARA